MSIKDLHVELLPTRTVLTVVAKGGPGGSAGDAGDAGVAITNPPGNHNVGHDQTIVTVSEANGAPSGSAEGGHSDAAAAGQDLKDA